MLFTISRKVFKIIQKHSYAFKYIPFFIRSYELWYCLVSQRLFDPPTVVHRRMKFVVDSNCHVDPDYQRARHGKRQKKHDEAKKNMEEGQIFHVNRKLKDGSSVSSTNGVKGKLPRL